MHEASIASELLNIVINECSKNGYSKIQTIKVIIGRATGVMTDALLFAFDVLKENTPAESANLIIEEIPVRGVCKDCGKEFESNEPYIVVVCPVCGSFSLEITAGKELNITEMEVN
jgi:hydrogenase nickel incorporation protein HypA/HybF